MRWLCRSTRSYSDILVATLSPDDDDWVFATLRLGDGSFGEVGARLKIPGIGSQVIRSSEGEVVFAGLDDDGLLRRRSWRRDDSGATVHVRGGALSFGRTGPEPDEWAVNTRAGVCVVSIPELSERECFALADGVEFAGPWSVVDLGGEVQFRHPGGVEWFEIDARPLAVGAHGDAVTCASFGSIQGFRLGEGVDAVWHVDAPESSGAVVTWNEGEGVWVVVTRNSGSFVIDGAGAVVDRFATPYFDHHVLAHDGTYLTREYRAEGVSSVARRRLADTSLVWEVVGDLPID